MPQNHHITFNPNILLAELTAIPTSDINPDAVRQAFEILKRYGASQLKPNPKSGLVIAPEAVAPIKGMIEELHNKRQVAPHTMIRYGRLTEILMRIELLRLPAHFRHGIYKLSFKELKYYKA